MTNIVELELTNGKRVLIPRNLDNIHHLYERKKIFFRFMSSFPFFKLEKRCVVRFQFRTHYEIIDDFFDPRYEVNCTLSQFASLMGIEFFRLMFG